MMAFAGLRAHGRSALAIAAADLSMLARSNSEFPKSWVVGREVAKDQPKNLACPRITIVTPSFNQGQYIEDTIKSVLLQGYPNLEYIIVDGGSTDGTVEIIRKYEPWISYWESTPDRGQADALNKGFARATGRICAYINSDDYYLPGAFEYVAAMSRRTQFNFLFGRNQLANRARSRKSIIRDALAPIPHPLLVGHPIYAIAQDASFWSLDDATKFDEGFQFCLDVEFFLRSVSGQLVVMSDRGLSFFREHPASKTSSIRHIGEQESKRLRESIQDRGVGAAQQERIVRSYRAENLKTHFARLAGRRGPAEFIYRHP